MSLLGSTGDGIGNIEDDWSFCRQRQPRDVSIKRPDGLLNTAQILASAPCVAVGPTSGLSQLSQVAAMCR
jgi:hypothetical protein